MVHHGHGSSWSSAYHARNPGQWEISGSKSIPRWEYDLFLDIWYSESCLKIMGENRRPNIVVFDVDPGNDKMWVQISSFVLLI